MRFGLAFCNQLLQRLDMFSKRFLPGSGRNVSCVWFFSNELFFDHNVIFAFQCFGMARKITVGNAEHFFQHIEISAFIDHQYRHDPQTNPVIESLIDILDDVLQNLVSIVFKIHQTSVKDMANAKPQSPKQ